MFNFALTHVDYFQYIYTVIETKLDFVSFDNKNLHRRRKFVGKRDFNFPYKRPSFQGILEGLEEMSYSSFNFAQDDQGSFRTLLEGWSGSMSESQICDVISAKRYRFSSKLLLVNYHLKQHGYGRTLSPGCLASLFGFSAKQCISVNTCIFACQVKAQVVIFDPLRQLHLF